MLRSEDMVVSDLYIQSETAFANLTRMGEMECVQFIDMNPDLSPLSRHFVTDMCRCADMESILLNIREEILKEGISIVRIRDLTEIKPLPPTEMFEFENMIDSVAKDVKDMNANYMNLKKLISETKEISYVLNHLDPILGDVASGNTKLPNLVRPENERQQLKIITGVVDRANSYHLQIMLWRVSRGKYYYKEAPYDDTFQNPTTGRLVRKVAFVIICHGDELQQRLLKVCNGFNVNLYRWPETHDDRISTINELTKRMGEMDKVLQRTNTQRIATFHTMARQWETWMTQVRKAKAIYFNLNLFNFEISSNTLVGQCWLADNDFDKVETELERTSELAGTRSFMVRSHPDEVGAVPPSYFKTNKFTAAYQSIINTYDYGRYKELNPGVFSIILFPFLFGVMFGDIGHGVILLIYAMWMINNEQKFLPRRATNEVWGLIFAGRYMILVMAIFVIFMGFMYNEFFGQPTKYMSAFWLNTVQPAMIGQSDKHNLNPYLTTGYVNIFGIDPGIKLSMDSFKIENSVKMKLAIIIGLSHLTFGLILAIANCTYYKKKYAIACHILPRIIFIWCFYGWFCVLIFHKWFYGLKPKAPAQSWPNLKEVFLYMIFWREPKITTYGDLQKYISYLPIHKIFGPIQSALYHIGLIMFLVMLFASPFYLFMKNTRKASEIRKKKGEVFLPHHTTTAMPVQVGTTKPRNETDIECPMRCAALRAPGKMTTRPPIQTSIIMCDEYKKHKSTNFWDLLAHRTMRTMEYAFSLVSHMASYLRLWALSMAHSLLTRFLWDLTLRSMALSDRSRNGIWKLIFTFALWAILTTFFLILMDGLAVFVHVLRLQWVEFMSKFFKGGGWPFQPFSLNAVLDDLDHKYEEDRAQAICKMKEARMNAEELI